MNIYKKVGAFVLTGVLLIACDSPADSSVTQSKSDTVNMQKGVARAMPEVVMYKSAGCECCSKWAEHLKGAGFSVIEHKRDDMDVIKAEYGVTEKLASCHTGLVDGYVIEGHVPATDIKRLLKDRPDIIGLTAPGMPMKSPGMQSIGQKPQGYDVLAFDKNGNTTVFHKY